MNEEIQLEKFRKWIREWPVPVDPNRLLTAEQFDDLIPDYIEDFCCEMKYKGQTTEQMLGWIGLRNEVYVFLEEQGIKRPDE